MTGLASAGGSGRRVERASQPTPGQDPNPNPNPDHIALALAMRCSVTTLQLGHASVVVRLESRLRRVVVVGNG